MQIRVANRQDEPIIRTIVNQALAERGQSEVDLKGRDEDLNNVEQHYFWYDGLFLVAEEDGQIIGLVGARKSEHDESLELLRLVVVPAHRQKGVARQLMDTVFFFARNLEYKEVSCMFEVDPNWGSPTTGDFKLDDTKGNRWVIPVGSTRALSEQPTLPPG